MRISVKMEEVLPEIERVIRTKLKIPDNIMLVYTSGTTFLTFDTVEEPK